MRGFKSRAAAQDSRMQDAGHEPGLELHELETRWQQLVEVAHESPADAVGEIDRLFAEALEQQGYVSDDDEARRQYEAAHELTVGYERGEASAGDLAEAINGYRELYELLTSEHLDPPQRAGGTGRSA
jgi:hypothetical protein